MTRSYGDKKYSNISISDPESGAEMIRLIEQELLVINGMSSLFPERSNGFSRILRVLDTSQKRNGSIVARCSWIVIWQQYTPRHFGLFIYEEADLQRPLLSNYQQRSLRLHKAHMG